MIDIKFIRENPKVVEEKALAKGFKVDVGTLLKIDEQRRVLVETVDAIRQQRNEAAKSRDEEKGSRLKSELKAKEDELEKVTEEFYKRVREVPNLSKDDVKKGKDDSENETVKEVGKKPDFDFEPKDHLELGLGLDLIDTDRASKISGSRFAFLKNELVALEFAIVRYAMDTLTAEGFIPIIPPVILDKKAVVGLGYPEYETSESYQLPEDQYLVGTAEHSIVPMHMDETFQAKDLPIRYVAFSTAFRREAGSYGKDTRGIFRVHQFDKVEMVSFVLPQDDDREHEYLVSLEEKMMHELGLPYRLVKMCTGDLGFPTARKYDIEAWIPSQKQYRETHSASTNTNFQSRRLNIKYHDGNEKGFVSILNGTAFAIGRTIIAILENNQQKDGSIEIPKVLQKYTGFPNIPR